MSIPAKNTKNRGLGKGLDLLLKKNSDTEDPSLEIREIPLGHIVPNPSQPRRKFSPETIQELADSIAAQGVIQPALVRPVPSDPEKYELVAGERRWRAAHMAGLDVMPVLIRDMDDRESLAIALIENLQREDLNPVEEALALKNIKEQFNINQDELARRVGKSRPAVANAIRLLNLPEHIRKDLSNGVISTGHARALLGIEEEEVQARAHTAIVARGLTVRQAEQFIKEIKNGDAQLPEPVPGKRGSDPAAREFKKKFQAVLQEHLGDKHRIKVAVQGSQDKGHIALKYANPEERERIMALLGMDSAQ
ncbi:MAG TPA: ParB/RepB/Spo0J family partition protein [Desulfomicrobiaceae bacterium]|nr:ParB/RepB/Spo0J family partition protein [Desulfomicrobiaceae bacterium]